MKCEHSDYVSINELCAVFITFFFFVLQIEATNGKILI